MDPTDSETIRFWRRVSYSPTGCWEWKGAHANYGYGQVYIGGRIQRAHRIAWEMFYGPIPPGIKVCHACDNPPCVRPDHLFLGTQADNLHDMLAKGRHFTPFGSREQRGEANLTAKLTEKSVREIRRLGAYGMFQKDIAARYGITLSNVGCILRRETWKHLD